MVRKKKYSDRFCKTKPLTHLFAMALHALSLLLAPPPDCEGSTSHLPLSGLWHVGRNF